MVGGLTVPRLLLFILPTIVHYTGYEITQLRAMATDGVPLAAELLELILARSVDLEKIVS